MLDLGILVFGKIAGISFYASTILRFSLAILWFVEFQNSSLYVTKNAFVSRKFSDSEFQYFVLINDCDICIKTEEIWKAWYFVFLR